MMSRTSLRSGLACSIIGLTACSGTEEPSSRTSSRRGDTASQSGDGVTGGDTAGGDFPGGGADYDLSGDLDGILDGDLGGILNGDLTFAGSCTLTDSCWDFTVLTSGDFVCGLLGGTYSATDTCPTDGRIGTCTRTEYGLVVDIRYYAPTDPATAEADCAANSGTWIAD